MEAGIYLSQVIAEYRASGLSGHHAAFDLTYRKADGTHGAKRQVRRRAGEVAAQKRDLASIKHENRQAGKMHLVDQGGTKFDLFICLLERFNGRLIDHRF